ncbi:DUF5304 domain-containing protein [Streptomyces sp. NPDC049577]|uniref:DUF5304 domain-containing protein n=1 Tax=Streptomyces sp. NPDC049577 TaxID=3155153 RepID=UPI003419DFF8
MSDATERPGSGPGPEPDAWARACAEDLAAENARRRAGEAGERPGSAAEELRKLVDAVADKVAGLQLPLAGAAAQGAVSHFVDRAKAAVEPVIERNPEVFDHLASAGSELLAAYRAAVQGHERRWASGGTGAPHRPGPDGGDQGPGGTEHIDLD